MRLPHALRSFRRRPTFAIGSILMLSAALAATVSTYEVSRTVLWRPFPFADPEQVAFVYARDKSPAANPNAARGSAGAAEVGLSVEDAADLERNAATVTDLALFTPFAANVTDAQQPFQIRGASVTPNFFSVLGVRFRVGAGFQPADDALAGGNAIVISERAWQDRWGGDPAIVGRHVRLDGVSYRVNGIVPQEFEWPEHVELDVFRAVQPRFDPARRAVRFWTGVVRFNGSIAAVRAELTNIADGLEAQFADSNKNIGVAVYGARELIPLPVRRGLWLVFAATALLLVVTCTNIGSVQIVEAIARRAEHAIRHSLGASRGRLAADAVTEAFLIGVPSGALALLWTWWTLRLLATWLPITRIQSAGVSPALLMFLALLTALASLLLAGIRAGVSQMTWDRGLLRSRGVSVGRRPRLLVGTAVVVQLSFAIGLLGVAGLLIRTAEELSHVAPGIDAGGVTSFHVPLSRQQRQPEVAARIISQIRTNLAELPGTISAGAVLQLPLSGMDVDVTQVELPGRSRGPGERPSTARLHVVTPGYFGAVGMRVVSGRDFGGADTRDGAPVAIVNEAMARQRWPDRGPLGQTLTQSLLLTPGEPSTRTVIGVVNDVKHFGLHLSSEPQMYVPHGQSPWPAMYFAVRHRLPEAAIVPLIRESVAAVDPLLPVEQLGFMQSVVDAATSGYRLRAGLVSGIALVALAVAFVGLAAVLGYFVAQRTKEMGIRMALGATRPQIALLMFRSAAGMTLAAAVCGGGILLAAGQLFRAQLFGVSLLDPKALVVVAVISVVCVFLASAVPLRRAMGVDPRDALAAE